MRNCNTITKGFNCKQFESIFEFGISNIILPSKRFSEFHQRWSPYLWSRSYFYKISKLRTDLLNLGEEFVERVFRPSFFVYLIFIQN